MTNDKDSAVLLPCPFCGEQCATLLINQGDKWAHYEPSCLEVRTAYNLSNDAPWRDEAAAAWNTRQPTQSDALREAAIEECAKALEADAMKCDCAALEERECGCGAWCEWKSITSARAVEIIRALAT